MWAVGRDKSYWERPDTFDQDRFLNAHGEVDTTKVENAAPFGAGKRKCLGELLGRIELFVFFTVLLQHCRFEKASGEVYSFQAKYGFGLEPPLYKVMITSRNN